MRKMLFGPLVHAENRGLADLGPREIGLSIPIVVLFVWIGVQPNAFLDKTSASIDLVLERVDEVREDLRVGKAPLPVSETRDEAREVGR